MGIFVVVVVVSVCASFLWTTHFWSHQTIRRGLHEMQIEMKKKQSKNYAVQTKTPTYRRRSITQEMNRRTNQPNSKSQHIG